MNDIAHQPKNIIIRLADVDTVVKRIEKKVPSPLKREEMIEKVETYDKTKNPRDDIDLRETHMIYPTDEMGDEFDIPNSRREVDINWTSHANYRRELRDIDGFSLNEKIVDLLERDKGIKRQQKVRLNGWGGTAIIDVDGRRPSDIEADVITVWK